MGEMINGRTPEEIKSGLQCHVRYGNCDTECPYEDVHNEPRHECIQNMTKDALALIERLEATRPKWISVEERLPEENQTVLVWADGCASIAEVYDKDMITGEAVWSYTGLGCAPWYWMPLPEPPKEEPNA